MDRTFAQVALILLIPLGGCGAKDKADTYASSSTAPATTRSTTDQTASAALAEYFLDYKEGEFEKAADFFDAETILRGVAGDADWNRLSNTHRDSAVAQLRRFVTQPFNSPWGKDMTKQITYREITSEAMSDGNIRITSVATTANPPIEIKNVTTLHHDNRGWRIIDSEVPGQGALVHTMHGAYLMFQKETGGTIEQLMQMAGDRVVDKYKHPPPAVSPVGGFHL